MATTNKISLSNLGFYKMVAVLIICVIGIGALLNFCNVRVENHIIRSMEKIEDRHGDANSIKTDVYTIVYTDKGAYRVVMSGFNAAPDVLGKFSPGDTVLLKTRGVNFPFLNMYSNIVEVL